MSEATTITISRSVPVPPERAFAAWVDPEELAQWWWPQWPDTTYDLDVRAGGHYRMHSAAAGFGVTGELTVVEPPHRLAMTWIWTRERNRPPPTTPSPTSSRSPSSPTGPAPA